MNRDSFLIRLSSAHYYPWIVWGLGALFFCVEYFARLAPSVMVQDLMQAFNVDALGIGVLSGWFYVAYLSMQLPVGVLVDRYGANRLLVFAALISGASCFILACADSLWVACIARFMIGFGGAFAFVGTLKLATIWFPSSKFGLLAGMTQALGMLGASMGEGPVSLVVGAVGWRDTMVIMGVALVVVGLLILTLVKDSKGQGGVIKPAQQLSSMQDIWQGLIEVLRNRQTWIVSFIAGLLYAPTASFGELWGVAYIETVQGLSHHTAAHAVSMIFLGWTIGGPISGWMSDYLGKRKPGLFVSSVGSFISLTLVLYVPTLSAVSVFVLLFLYGVFNTGVVNTYALSGEINRQSIAGISMAFTNMSSVLFGFLFQPLIGWVLNIHWLGELSGRVKIYPIEAYQMAVIMLPVCMFLAFCFSFKVEETYCKRICS